MKAKIMTWERMGLLVAFPMMVAVMGQAQERLGTIRQSLVGGSVVDAARQEEFALLTYNSAAGSCSASLLRNGWVITAAHCVEAEDANSNPMPDRARPGQNVLTPIGSMTLTANWKTNQSANVVRVETFRPYDVALIQVDKPFQWGGSTTGYSRLIFQDGQFPYFGQPVGADLVVFGRGISKFATGSGTSAVPSVRDGLYRVGYFKPTYMKDNRYYFPSVNGQMGAGGDSGGPSFAWGLNGYALVGVHSEGQAIYMPGKPKKPTWDWVTSTPESGDAPIAPVWDQILRIIGPPPLQPRVALTPPPPGFVGTFAQTPPDYHPLWLYGISPNGDLQWYRKDSNASAWQGPKKVATGWNLYKDVIPAGGNRMYALTNDGKLLWFQHKGFNDGSAQWAGPIEVAKNWAFARIFSGGDGIVYALRKDGTLLWTRNNGFNHESPSWQDFKVVRTHFDPAIIKEIFSTGHGAIYMMRKDILRDRLIYEQHDGYATGEAKWSGSRPVGTGWDKFQQIIPSGDGVIMAIRPDGGLVWYHHRVVIAGKDAWDGPIQLGTGWQDFGKVISMIADPLPTVH